MNQHTAAESSLSEAELHILLALASGPLHGYGLVRRMEAESGGRVRLLPGNLYAVLRRLEGRDLVRLSRTRPLAGEDQRRRYYEITAAGKAILAGEARRLDDLLSTLRSRLEGEVIA